MSLDTFEHAPSELPGSSALGSGELEDEVGDAGEVLGRGVYATAGRGPRGDDVAARLRAFRNRIELLELKDRMLIELVPTGQRSLREVARLLDVSPGQLSRRLRALLRRIDHPFVHHLFHKSCLLPPPLRQVGIEYYLQDLTLRAIADKHRLSERETKAMLDQLKGYAKAMRIKV